MNNSLKIRIKKLDERAVIPTYAHTDNGDVCMDITAISVEYDADKDMYIYHTGLAFEGVENYAQFLFLRSSNCKTEAYLCNHVGVVDPSYRGEVQFRMKNRTSLEVMRDIAYCMAIVNNINNKNANLEEIGREASVDVLQKAKNLDYAPYNVGDRVGQMVFINYPTVEFEVVDELNTSVRGEGGFGSTGN